MSSNSASVLRSVRVLDHSVEASGLTFGLFDTSWRLQDTRFLKPLMTKLNATEKQLREAVMSIRGNSVITSRNPEASYQVRHYNFTLHQHCFFSSPSSTRLGRSLSPAIGSARESVA